MPVALALLLGAASAEVPVGKFQTWFSSERAPLAFTSGGVSIRAEALPCPARPPHSDDSSCSWEGYNNQAAVTVTAPGLQPVRVLTDSQSSYARIAVVRFDRRNPAPGVIVESQYGGSGGDMTVQMILPARHGGYRTIGFADRRGAHLQGKIADFPSDISGDGRADLKLEDGRFDSAFGCNACSPRPPLFFAVKQGVVVEESRDPALRHVFAAEMARLRSGCFSTEHDRNGSCAAYVAVAARAGRFAQGWAGMLRHYERGEREIWLRESVKQTFPQALKAFLIRAGYLPA